MILGTRPARPLISPQRAITHRMIRRAILCAADCLLFAHDFMLMITDRGISRRRPGETPLIEAEPTTQQ
jgi:hypothetical protein